MPVWTYSISIKELCFKFGGILICEIDKVRCRATDVKVRGVGKKCIYYRKMQRPWIERTPPRRFYYTYTKKESLGEPKARCHYKGVVLFYISTPNPPVPSPLYICVSILSPQSFPLLCPHLVHPFVPHHPFEQSAHNLQSPISFSFSILRGKKKLMFSFPIHPSLFIRIFHSHPFPHSFTPTLSSSLTLGRRRKRRAGRRGRYFHTSMSLSLPMLGLARRRSRSRLVFLGMGMALGVGTALLLLFWFVIIPSGDERVDLFFQKVVSWKKRRGKRRKKKTYKTDIFKQIRKDPNRPLHRQHRHTPKHQSHHRQP